MLLIFLAVGLTYMQTSLENILQMVWHLRGAQAALMDRHDKVLWPEVGLRATIPTHRHYTAFPQRDFALGSQIPKEISSISSQRLSARL